MAMNNVEINPVVTFTGDYSSPLRTKFDSGATEAKPSLEKEYKDADAKYLNRIHIYETDEPEIKDYTEYRPYSYDPEGLHRVPTADYPELYRRGVVLVTDRRHEEIDEQTGKTYLRGYLIYSLPEHYVEAWEMGDEGVQVVTRVLIFPFFSNDNQ